MKRLLILVLLSAGLATSACVKAAVSRPSTTQPKEGAVPTPVSLLIGSFVWQTDGLFGYRMLRPAAWNAENLGPGRGYMTPGFQDTPNHILLLAANLQALDDKPGGVIAQRFLFEQNPSLEAWTAGIEQLWKTNQLQFGLLRTLPQARIYLVRSPDSPDTQIVAYAIDQNQPLTVALTASGTYADLERLQEEGIVDDFAAMVDSVRAIDYDPTNVAPPLSP